MRQTEREIWLDGEGKIGREDRIERLTWLANLTPACEFLTFPGGYLAKQLFEESRCCFACGQFLASIVLGMAYIEHTLAALLYGTGQSQFEKAAISEILREAVKLNWLTDAEFKNLDHARLCAIQ